MNIFISGQFVQTYLRTKSSGLLLGTGTTSALALLGQKDSLDVWQDTALGDRHPRHQLVELLIIPGAINS